MTEHNLEPECADLAPSAKHDTDPTKQQLETRLQRSCREGAEPSNEHTAAAAVGCGLCGEAAAGKEPISLLLYVPVEVYFVYQFQHKRNEGQGETVILIWGDK